MFKEAAQAVSALPTSGESLRIPLTRGKFAIVDSNDRAIVQPFRWHAQCWNSRRDDSRLWYAATWEGGKLILMHRLIIGAPDGSLVDHRDFDGLNNRRGNLRTCSLSDNNRHARQPLGASGFRGVKWDRTNAKWRSRIQVDKVEIHLGMHEDKVAAAHAYDIAAKRYHGEFAILNFPDAVVSSW